MSRRVKLADPAWIYSVRGLKTPDGWVVITFVMPCGCPFGTEIVSVSVRKKTLKRIQGLSCISYEQRSLPALSGEDFKDGMKAGLAWLNQFPPRATGAKLVYGVTCIYPTSGFFAPLICFICAFAVMK